MPVVGGVQSRQGNKQYTRYLGPMSKTTGISSGVSRVSVNVGGSLRLLHRRSWMFAAIARRLFFRHGSLAKQAMARHQTRRRQTRNVREKEIFTWT